MRGHLCMEPMCTVVPMAGRYSSAAHTREAESTMLKTDLRPLPVRGGKDAVAQS